MTKINDLQSEVKGEGALSIDAFSSDMIFSDKELSILDSLRLIRPELAAFYKDGLYIKKHPFDSKSYILAHLMREIDGGLRDVFDKQVNAVEVKCEKCGKPEKKVLDDAFKKEVATLYEKCKKEYVNFDYLKGCDFKKFKKHSAHAYSILSSFHLSIAEPIAIEYIMVAIWFHKYAHRDSHSGYESLPRREEDVMKMWNKFEAVLYELFNTIKYERIDDLLKKTNPSPIDLEKIRIIQKADLDRRYFWGRLHHFGWLEPLYNEGYFTGVNNPTPIFQESTGEYIVSYWPELVYVQNTASLMSTAPDADFSIILKIIDDICLYKNKDGKRIVNYNTDSAILFLISLVPLEDIRQKHFNYFTTIIKSKNGNQYSDIFQKRFIDRFIAANDKKNLLRCFPIILSHRKKRGLFESPHSLLDRYFLHELIDKKIEDIIRICGIEGFKSVEKVLKVVERDHLHSLMAIEDHYQNGQNLDKFSHQVVRFIREYLLKIPCDDRLIQIVSDYLHKDRITVYLRIAYFIINSRYEELNHLFWDIDFNPLKIVSNRHELFELLKKHSPLFNKDQINRALAWINELDNYYQFDGKQHPSPDKKLWLTALMETQDLTIAAEYEKAKELYPYEIEHPGFSGWMESVFGNISPASYESVQNMDLHKLINYYSNYEEKPHRTITDPTIEGLNDVIKLDVKNNILKYTHNIEVIYSTPIGFQYSWIIGLWQYCYDNKTYIDSSDVFILILKIISSANFKKDYVDDNSFRNKNKWFAHRVLSLLNCGLDCHGHMFSVQNLPLVKEIILDLYKNDNDAEIVKDRDISHQYFNSYSGELYGALIEYNVVEAYKSNAPIGNRWDDDIKCILDSELSKEQKNPLFFYALGNKFYSLLWIDESWLKNILTIEDCDNWKGFMVGFHFNNIVSQVFEDFCNSGQYDRFFSNRDYFDSVTQNKVIQYICTAYYSEKINFDLNSPLLISVLNERNALDYENIIQFFYRNHKDLPIEKVKDLWRYMYHLNKELDNDVSKYFIGESYRWLDFFDNIDEEIKEWMLLSVKNLQPFSASEVIKKLTVYTKNNPIQVGELLLALVSSELKIPMFSDLEIIVEELCELGHIEIAIHISNECLRKGYLGLRKIVSEYR